MMVYPTLKVNSHGTVLVAKDGQVIFKKGYGMANYEEEIPNKPKTVQAITSLTKAFASMSIMMLEERGLLSVDDTIAAYIPEFPGGDRVTLHHLLSQSSGLFEYLYNPDIWMNIDQFQLHHFGHYPGKSIGHEIPGFYQSKYSRSLIPPVPSIPPS